MLTYRVPIRDPGFHWTADEVLRDVAERPHLFVRLELAGPYFPQRAEEPFVRVGEVRSRFVIIADDGLWARGYFLQLPAAGLEVEFGYGDRVVYVFRRKFEPGLLNLLDRNRLPPETVIVPALKRRRR